MIDLPRFAGAGLIRPHCGNFGIINIIMLYCSNRVYNAIIKFGMEFGYRGEVEPGYKIKSDYNTNVL